MNLPSWIETDLDRSKWIAYNRYFKDNPEMLMGEMVSSRNMYGNEDGTACVAPEDFDLNQHLTQAVDSLYARLPQSRMKKSRRTNRKKAIQSMRTLRPEPKTSPMLFGMARSSSVKR